MSSRSAPNFEHKPLPDSSWIRLLRIEPRRGCISCRLETFELDSCPGHTALSYEWGDATPRHDICINGHYRKVHDSLWRFLFRSLEARFEGYLWTDSLCLDQANQKELTVQIARMAEIYESAEKVVVWLGDNPRLVRELQSGTCRMALRSSYWKRVWVIQEIAFARKLTVIYGPCEIDFEGLKSSMSNWISRDSAVHMQDPCEFMEAIERLRENHEDFFKHIHWLVMWRENVQKGPTGTLPVSFSRIFSALLSSKSTKNRDAAYGLASLAARLCPSWSPKDLAINYDKPDYHVFWDLVFELDDKFLTLSDRSFDNLSKVRNRIVGPTESSTWFENAHDELEQYEHGNATSATYKRQAELALWTMKTISALQYYVLEPWHGVGSISASNAQATRVFRFPKLAVELINREAIFHRYPSTRQDFFLAWRCDLQRAKEVRGANQAVTETSNAVETTARPIMPR